MATALGTPPSARSKEAAHHQAQAGAFRRAAKAATRAAARAAGVDADAAERDYTRGSTMVPPSRPQHWMLVI